MQSALHAAVRVRVSLRHGPPKTSCDCKGRCLSYRKHVTRDLRSLCESSRNRFCARASRHHHVLTSQPSPPEPSQTSSWSPLSTVTLLGCLILAWFALKRLTAALLRATQQHQPQQDPSRKTDDNGSAAHITEAGELAAASAGTKEDVDSGGLDVYADAEQEDLGRVVVCAALAQPVSSHELHSAAFSDVLETWSGGVMGPLPGGMLLVYPRALLICIEAGNHQLMALLRDSLASSTWCEQQGIIDARVLSFVLDVRERAFSSAWHCAYAGASTQAGSAGGRDRSALSSARKSLGVGAAVPGPLGAAAGGGAAQTAEVEWARKVQDLEHFAVRVASLKLQGMDQAMAASVLRDPAQFFGPSILPSQATILELAKHELGPHVSKFVDTFDVDYSMWKDLAIQASQGSPSAQSNPDLLRLACFYQPHALREEAAEQERQAAKGNPTASPLARFYPQHPA